MGWSMPDARFSGSGDDSVLIDQGRFTTKNNVDKRMNNIIKYHKSKKNIVQSQPTINEEDVLSK